jgi:hypothetical protein
VGEDQQTRLLEAMAQTMAELGTGPCGPSLAALQSRSGASAAAVKRLLADREAALAAAFELALERAAEPVRAAFDAEPRWLDAIKAGLVALLAFLEEQPALGRVLVLGASGGGERLLRRRAQIARQLAAAIDAGRLKVVAGRRAPEPLVALGVVGAMQALLEQGMLGEPPRRPTEQFGELVSVLVLPYLGPAAARRELHRPAPPPRTARASPPNEAEGTPRRSRLTHRSTVVLGSIGAHPGASNSEVAERAGVVDQGQISKLLGRLEARGLIERLGERRARGAPNSWRLTGEGERALDAT